MNEATRMPHVTYIELFRVCEFLHQRNLHKPVAHA